MRSNRYIAGNTVTICSAEQRSSRLGIFRLFQNKNLLIVLGIVLIAVFSFGYESSSDFIVQFSKIVGSGWAVVQSNNFSVGGTGVESIGYTPLSSKDFEISTYPWDIVTSKLANDLSNAHVYPNPYEPNSNLGHAKITFSRLTGHVKIKVIDIAGELVYSTEADTPMGVLPWDVTNNSGQKLATGVYVYFISDNKGHKKIGKFAVVR